MATDDALRGTLEAGDIALNDFVSDEDYCVAKQQRGGLSRALTDFPSGENIDALVLAKIVGQGVTEEGEARLQQIHERIRGESETTLERHREWRRVRKAMVP